MDDVIQICTVEPGTGRKRYSVVLWSPNSNERCTLEGFTNRRDAEDHANRVSRFVREWMMEMTP